MGLQNVCKTVETVGNPKPIPLPGVSQRLPAISEGEYKSKTSPNALQVWLIDMIPFQGGLPSMISLLPFFSACFPPSLERRSDRHEQALCAKLGEPRQHRGHETSEETCRRSWGRGCTWGGEEELSWASTTPTSLVLALCFEAPWCAQYLPGNNVFLWSFASPGHIVSWRPTTSRDAKFEVIQV